MDWFTVQLHLLQYKERFYFCTDLIQYTNVLDVDWFSVGKESLSKLQKQRPVIRRAKNVILFIGDGMGISTNTAARLYKGELRGNTGPEENLVYESFPHTALSKVSMMLKWVWGGIYNCYVKNLLCVNYTTHLKIYRSCHELFTFLSDCIKAKKSANKEWAHYSLF